MRKSTIHDFTKIYANALELLGKQSPDNRFIEKLEFHNLIPLFYEYSRQTNQTLTNDFGKLLKIKYKKLSIRCLHKITVLNEIIGLLINHQIPYILFKGNTLSQIIYGNACFRSGNDIDILLPQEYIKTVENLIIRKNGVIKRPLQSTFIQNQGKHSAPIFYKNISIELHFQLYKSTNQPINAWNEIKQYPFQNNSCSSFSIPFYIYYLLLHAWNHLNKGKFKLIWYVDIACLISKYNKTEIINKVYQFAEKEKTISEINNSINLVHTYLFNNFTFQPKNFEKNISIEKLFCEICKEAKVVKNQSLYPENFHSYSLFNKIRIIMGILFPSYQYIRFRYGYSSVLINMILLILNPIRILISFCTFYIRKLHNS